MRLLERLADIAAHRGRADLPPHAVAADYRGRLLRLSTAIAATALRVCVAERAETSRGDEPAAGQAGGKAVVGYACITHSDFMWISGYASRNRPADGLLAERWAKAIVLEDSTGTQHLLMTRDLVGIDRGTPRTLANAITNRHGSAREAITIATWHIRSRPVVRYNLCTMHAPNDAGWALVRRYGVQMHEAVLAAMAAAIADLVPAELAWTGGRDRFTVNPLNKLENNATDLGTADWLDEPVNHDVPMRLVRSRGVEGPDGVRALPKNDGSHRPLMPISDALAAVYAEIPRAFSASPLRANLEAARARMAEEVWGRHVGLQAAYPYPVRTWRVGGEPLWVFLRGEMAVDFALPLNLAAVCGSTRVTRSCYDVMDCIASRRMLAEGFDQRGGAWVYRGLTALWGMSSEDAIVDAACRQVEATSGVAADPPRSIALRPYPDHAGCTVELDTAGIAIGPLDSPADWERGRHGIIGGIMSAIVRLPTADELGPLKVVASSHESIEGYPRLLLRNSRAAPASDSGAAPGSQRVIAHLYPPVPRENPPPNRGCGSELASRGYVVLAPRDLWFGELVHYGPDPDGDSSRTILATNNHRRGVDLLVSRPEVDPERTGVISRSLQSHNALYKKVFGKRVTEMRSRCGWHLFATYKRGKLADWPQNRYLLHVRERAGQDPARMRGNFGEATLGFAPHGFSRQPRCTTKTYRRPPRPLPTRSSTVSTRCPPPPGPACGSAIATTTALHACGRRIWVSQSYGGGSGRAST